MDLLKKLLNSDPKKRCSAKEALSHPWFGSNQEFSQKIYLSLKSRLSIFSKRLSQVPEEIKADNEKSMNFKETLNETSLKDSFFFEGKKILDSSLTERHKTVKKFWNSGQKMQRKNQDFDVK